MNYQEQINQSIYDALAANPKALVLGAGVTDHKHIFNTTQRAHEAFPGRVIETPLSEMMLTGALAGLAQTGFAPIFVHARADFMTLSTEHIVNTIAKHKYLTGKPLQVMVRCIIGQGWGNGPQHTQSFAHWFASVPGLSVFTPHSKQGIEAAFDNWKRGNPTVVFEHRALYGTDLKRHGWRHVEPDIVLTGVSAAMQKTFDAQRLLDTLGVNANVTSIENWNNQLYGSWYKQVYVDIAPRAPLMRSVHHAKDHSFVHPPDYPCPASYPLEQAWYPSAERIANAALELLGKEPVFTEPEAHVAAPTGGGPF